MALKRDVLMRAAEASAILQGFLAGFADLRIPTNERHLELGEKIGWLNQLHLVVSEETILEFVRLGEFYTDRLISLLRLRFEFDHSQASCDAAKQRLAHMRDLEQTRMELLSKELVPKAFQGSGLPPERAAQLQQELNGLKALRAGIDGMEAEVARLEDRRNEKQIRLAEAASKASTDFAVALSKANVAARTELRLRLDRSRYEDIIRVSQTRLHERLVSAFRDAPELDSDSDITRA